MCGIVGIAALGNARPPRHDDLQRMCSVLVHRGPDDEGVGVQAGVGLGSRRLAVIDIAGGRQPITDASGAVRVVQNGEIYNFRELRRELERSGREFRTNSDTEVIVHAYEAFGDEFPKRLNGMFAAAVHDARHHRLILARDHLGIKPLYYAWTDSGHLVWGSEIKALLASGLLSPELDVDSLGQFLSWEYVPGRRTLMRDVFELQPAEMLIVDIRKATSQRHRYWDLRAARETATLDAGEWERRLDEQIGASVRRQLVSDVPLGGFLSGGVDSSVVAAAMGPARVFSIGFGEETYDELRFAGRVAGHLGLEQVREVLRPEVAPLFGTIMEYLDDPIGDFSVFPTYLMSRIAREHVTVALSGDGGDELFGGYDTYLAQRYAYWYKYLPGFLRERWMPAIAARVGPTPGKKGAINMLRHFIAGAQYPPEWRHARWRIFASDLLKAELLTPEASGQLETRTGAHIEYLVKEASGLPELDKELYVDLKSYLCDNCLVKVDRMSMASSLEVRVPLLDRELVELAFGMPSEFKIRRGMTKYMLKRVAARHVPGDCVYRAKQGFSMPMKHWLRTEFRPLMEELLDPRRIRAGGLFRFEAVERLKREHLDGRENHSHVLWSLVVFHAWQDRWLDGARLPRSSLSS